MTEARDLMRAANDRLIARLVGHGVPEDVARARIEAAWNQPPAVPLPTMEELDAMPDGPDISDAEIEAMLEADALAIVKSLRYPRPPIVVVNDLKTYRAEDTPDEFLEAIAEVLDLPDMTPEQQPIVDAGQAIAGKFSTGLTREELAAWIAARFGDTPITPEDILQDLADAQAGKFPVMEVDANTPDDVLNKFLGLKYLPQMQDIDWSSCPLVQCDPAYLGGVPAMRFAPRLPIEALVHNHLDGESIADIAYMFEVRTDEVQEIITYYHRHSDD